MSSSGYHPSPHLHRVSLHSHGKRPFEECGGYDSDNANMPIQPTTASGTSSSNNLRFSSTSTPAAEARNKRARSTSSSSTDASNPSSSSGYNTAQSSSRSDLSSDGPSVLPVNAVDCSVHPVVSPPSFVSTHDAHMSDLHLPIPHTQPQRTHVPTPPTPEDTLRTSLQRFAEFDRQIAALRTSLAATRSSPLPLLGPSVDRDPVPSSDHWHSNPSNFLSNASSGLPPSTTTGIASSTEAVAPSETLNSLNSLSTFASSNDSANVITSTSTDSEGVPSASFPPTYSNVPRYPPHPSYRLSAGGLASLVADERVGDAISSSSTPAFMRPSSNENTSRGGIRSSVSVEASAAPATSHIRRVRRSLSPLVFPSDLSSPPSIVTDDVLPRHRPLNGDRDSVNGRLHRRGIDSPVPSLDRDVSSRLDDHSGDQPRLSLQSRFGDGVRVIREHSTEREAVPSVFDVFNIGESSNDRIKPSTVRNPTASQYPSIAEPVPPRVPGTHNERSRGPVPTATAVNTNQGHSQDFHTRLHSSWTSIPSSNSLMSEGASERRHALAIERFRTRVRRSSFDADDESDTRWSSSSRGERERESARDLGIASPVPLSPSVESVPGTGTNSHFPPFGATRAPLSTNRAEPATSASLQRSVSELFVESQREIEGVEDWLLDWGERHRERERERQLERERQQEREWEWERSNQGVRGRSFASGLSLASTSSARDESLHPLVPTSSGLPRPTLGQLGAGPSTATSNVTATAMTTNSNNQQYSYSNLNLSSFQSGLFRDSLRRNAEVDQPSFSSNGPVMPPVITGDSRAASRLGLDDSGSEMDFDDFVRTRPPSPEWARPQPYAGRTPPPDYSPPPRNFSLRPGGFSVLRRGSIITYDSPGRSQPQSRNLLTPPAQPAASGPTRPIPARILESIYRSQEDGRRNGTTGTGQPYHLQHNHNHALTSGANAASRNERNDVGGPRGTSGNGNGNRPGSEVVRENRRSSLGLGGSIRSRLARFTNPQSSSNASDASSPSRQRSPSHPVGARPQVTEQHPHRRGSSVFGNATMVEYESRPEGRGVTGPPHWAVNAGSAESAVARDVPWRNSSGPRFAPPPPPTIGSARAEMSEVGGRVEESRSRLRSLRQRLQLDRGGEGMRVFRPGMLRAAMGRRGNFGDYVPDELFDDSYEALLSLSSMLGEVRSRATPEEVIASLPTGTFREWKKADSETRCPICLDDYEPSDVLTKLIECTHWLHKNCLEQWLRTADTCPVCREKVKSSPKPAPARRRYRDPSGPSETNHGGSGNGQAGQIGRPPPTNPQSNSGRPVSFAAMVFDRMMTDGRDTPVEPWPSSSSPVPAPPPTRDARSAFLERIRIQQQQQRAPQPSHTHDYNGVYMSIPPHESPYHLRVRPTSQSGSSPSRQTGGAGTSGTDGSSGRSFGFLLRGQGSDTSMSTTSSRSNMNMVVDDVGARHDPGRRPMAGTNGGPGSGPGSFLDGPTMPRWESVFPLVPPSSSNAFNGGGGPAPSPVPTTQSGFDPHPPTMVISSSTDSSREWRDTRMYDALFSGETSRSSSSSLGSFASDISAPLAPRVERPTGMMNRIPIDEESPFEEFVFGWSPRRGRVEHGYPFEEAPSRRGSGEGANSGL